MKGGTIIDDDTYYLSYKYKENLEALKFTEEKCTRINYDEDDNDITNDHDTYRKCIDIPSYKPMEKWQKLYLQAYYKYLFNRGMRNISTDSFMKLLNNDKEKYNLFFYYIFVELNLCIGYFIYTYNEITKSKLSKEHIFLLYKGGNTIRTIIELYSSEITNDNIKKYFIDYLNESNVSDWDYNIFIDISIIDEQFIKKLTLVFTKAFIRIQKMIEKYIMVFLPENIFNNLVIECNNQIEKINKTIRAFIQNNNSIYSDIHQNIIETITDFKFISNTDKQLQSYSVYEVKETENRLEPDIKKIIYKLPLQGELDNKHKYSYLVYLNDIYYHTKTDIINFNLFRLKLNNYINYNILYKHNKKTHNSLCGVELVDLSISYNKSLILKLLTNIIKTEDTYNMDNLKYISVDLQFNEIITTVQIPSIIYMILDIVSILYYDSLFPWTDSKYRVRIKRVLILVSLYYTSITQLQQQYISHVQKVPLLNFSEGKSIYDKIIIIIKQIIIGINHYEYKDIKEVLDNKDYNITITEIYNRFNTSLDFNEDLNCLSITNLDIKNPIFSIIINNILELIIYIYYICFYEDTEIMNTFKFKEYCDKKFEKYHACDKNDTCDINIGIYYKFSQLKSDYIYREFSNYIIALIELLTELSDYVSTEYISKHENPIVYTL
uniref:Uncharacterized protein n=1 Tax=viral metagenome TaxID=1070528 RepID=A0A6C0H8I7_9ZZZZ